MLAEPLAAALAAARAAQSERGRARRRARFTFRRQASRSRIGGSPNWRRQGDTTGLVLVAGRYEGIDERLFEREVDEEIAIGDFVVSGGELPALMLIDAVLRLRPGCVERRGVGAAGFVRRGAPRLSALHAAGGVRRSEGAGGAAFRAPRGDTRVALAAGAGPHVGAKAGSVGGPRAVDEERELLAAYRRERTAVAARWPAIATRGSQISRQ